MKKHSGGLLAVAGVALCAAILAMSDRTAVRDRIATFDTFDGPTFVSANSYAAEFDELQAAIAREKNAIRDAIRTPNSPSSNRQTSDHDSAGTATDDIEQMPIAQSPEPAVPTLVLEPDQADRPMLAVDDSIDPPIQDLHAESAEVPVAADDDFPALPEDFPAPPEESDPDRDAPLVFAERQSTPLAGNSEPVWQSAVEPFADDLSFAHSSSIANGSEPAPPLEPIGQTRLADQHDGAATVRGATHSTPSPWSEPEQQPVSSIDAWPPASTVATSPAWPTETRSHEEAPNNMASGSFNPAPRPADEPIASTADRGVTVLWQAPEAVNLGQLLDCRLIVENQGDHPALGVEIYVELPNGVRFADARPQAAAEDRLLVWRLGRLAPSETKQIELVIEPQQPGRIAPAVAVKSTSATRAQIDVLEPVLELVAEGAKQVTSGQAFAYRFQITNAGNGSATGVVLHLRTDPKLRAVTDDRTQIPIGTLSPGQSRRMELIFIASDSGTAQLQSAVTCEAQSTAQQANMVEILQPRLQVAVEGPRRRFVDRKATYVITVRNPGPAVAENVQITDRVPDGFRFHRASDGSSYDRSLRQVGWFIGRLGPNETTQVGVELIPTRPGEHHVAAAVQADAGARDEAHTVTRVEGAAAVALEVVDSDDPIELGGETTYEIRLSNQGTGAAQNVQLAAHLPDQFRPVDVRGPTRHRVEGSRLIFDPIATLEADESVVYRILVQCRAAGSARLRTFVRTDDEPEAVLEEELTRVYED